MAQLFGPGANSLAKVSIIVLVLLVSGLLVALDVIHRSPYVRYTHEPREQPVPFSHKHHLSLGLDCRYCHTTVEDSSFANIPPTRVCMNCHSVIWNDAPMLEPVRESWSTGESLEWVRVNDLPDFVYFNHSIHVAKGIGCEVCHGRVDQMPLTWREEPLFMKWCLDCHRAPEQFIRPKDKVFEMGYDPKAEGLTLEDRKQLVEEYHINVKQLDDCWICHR